MSNDPNSPRPFDYRNILNQPWPPNRPRVPNPEDVAEDMARGPARQASQSNQAAPVMAAPTTPVAGRAQTKVWVDANGNQERICDMAPQKLLGVLAMLKRAGETHRLLKIVALLHGDQSQYTFDKDTTLESMIKSSWREHVPRLDMFMSLETDWQRRFPQQRWDTQPSDPTVHNLGTNIENLISQLASPEKVTIVTAAARANRQINI